MRYRLVLLPALFLLSVPTACSQHGHDHQGHSDDATIDRRFEEPENWAGHFEDPKRDAWQHPDRIVETLCTRKDLVIADIGSATGYFPVRFAKACPEGLVLGADIEPGMVFYLNDRARKEGLPNLVSILAAPDDPHLPVPVDVVFICNTYHHINGRIDYFTRLQAQLSSGAKVAIVDYRLDSERGPPHKLSPEVVEEEMGKAGYTLAASPGFLPEQYFLIFEVAGGE